MKLKKNSGLINFNMYYMNFHNLLIKHVLYSPNKNVKLKYFILINENDGIFA